jgi:arginyl-tRNA synthetase
VGWEKYGDEALLKEDAVKHLYDVYVHINKTAEAEPEIHDAARAYFKAMEDDDEHALGLWKKFRDLSIEKYKETYARLNVHFDVYSGESQVSKQNIATALEHIRASDYVEKAENGALLIDLSKYKLEKAVIERKDGTPLYITRDIGEAKQRWDRFVEQRGDGLGFDKMIYVVASQQDLHLAQFFKVLELIGYEWAQPAAQRLLHINFGMVLGMSTRKGTAVFLEHILDEAKENMHNVMRSNEDKYAQVENPELTADVLGMTAVKVQDMGAKRINNYQFDWSRMLSFEGDTGPYMQYNHVRLCSVERRVADLDGVALPAVLDPSSLRLDLLAEPKAREVIMLLAAWPETVRANLKDLQPSTIVHFCFRLCHALSSAWEILIVRKQEKDLALARLFLFRCSKDVLSAAMRLLTIQRKSIAGSRAGQALTSILPCSAAAHVDASMGTQCADLGWSIGPSAVLAPMTAAGSAIKTYRFSSRRLALGACRGNGHDVAARAAGRRQSRPSQLVPRVTATVALARVCWPISSPWRASARS